MLRAPRYISSNDNWGPGSWSQLGPLDGVDLPCPLCLIGLAIGLYFLFKR